jgi:FkbM family methyltransferase
MRNLIVELGRHRWLHTIVAWLQIFALSEWILRRFPIERRLGLSGIRYRLSSLDQLSIEIEIFSLDAYAPALENRVVTSFIDLGCNAGWFALWLCARLDTKPLGLLIDAHPRLVSEAKWHIHQNGLSSCEVVHGIVGFPTYRRSANFYLQLSAAASSAVPFQQRQQLPAKGQIKTIVVPVISVAREWSGRFSDALVDVLKVDIEGKELDFVNVERSFLRTRVRRVIVEWHKWVVDLSDLLVAFREAGFSYTQTCAEGPVTGVAVFDNISKDDLGHGKTIHRFGRT